MTRADWQKLSGGLRLLVFSLFCWMLWYYLGQDPYYIYLLVMVTLVGFTIAVGTFMDWTKSLLTARNELKALRQLERAQRDLDHLISDWECRLDGEGE